MIRIIVFIGSTFGSIFMVELHSVFSFWLGVDGNESIKQFEKLLHAGVRSGSKLFSNSVFS